MPETRGEHAASRGARSDETLDNDGRTSDRVDDGCLVVYESFVNTESFGGAVQHFTGMSRALLGHPRVGQLVTITPTFERARANASRSAALSVRIPRNPAGALLYEVARFWHFARIASHRSSRGRRRVAMCRATPWGFATVFLRLLGYFVVLEVNGRPDSELNLRDFPRPVVLAARLALRVQIRSADLCVSVTSGLTGHCRDLGAKRAVTLPNGVELDAWPAPSGSGVLERERHRLVYSGTLAPWQDLATVIRALSEWKSRGADAELAIVGDGEDRASLEDLVRSLGLQDDVHFLGWQPRDGVHQACVDATICLAPIKPKDASGTCGSPLKVFEYLALGRPIVAADVDGITELPHPQIHRYANGDVEGLVTALEAAAREPSLDGAELESLRASIAWTSRAEDLIEAIGC